MPSTVDSVALAGMVDLLRCQGSWFQAVRLAFILGGGVNHGTTGLDYKVPAQAEFAALARVIEVRATFAMCTFLYVHFSPYS